MKKAVIMIISVIVALIILSQSIYTVDMTQQAIILQMGKYRYTVTEAGLHAKVPFIQSADHLEKRVLVSDAPHGIPYRGRGIGEEGDSGSCISLPDH